MRRVLPPALALLLLSPAIGELLSGSAPPVEFFNPVGFGLLVTLYGGGAIIMRELTLRWGKGKATLLVLGTAYGIIEEALMVKSFFNPAWMDLGLLGVYGRWLGVNWVWAFFLTLYHAIFSITIPIVLVELAYPERRRESWVGRRSFLIIVLAFIAVVLIGLAFFPYTPEPPAYLFFLIVTLLLLWLAYRLPADLGYGGTKALRRPLFWWVVGLAGSAAFFLGLFLGPTVIPHPALTIGVASLAAIVLVYWLTRFAWKEAKDTHKLSLTAGALSLMILIAFLQEFDASRPDNPAGMSIVAIGFALLLLLLWRRVRRAEFLRRANVPVEPHL